MLRTIDPRLNADILHALACMGHGDELVISDLKFPSDSVARLTPCGRPIRMENLGCAEAAEAILTLMPLDTFVENAAYCMQVVGAPDEIPPVVREIQAALDAAPEGPWPLGALERFAFYERAKKTYCVVVSGERRFYGNVILTKGVIPPDA
jgi:L-fucose mutarotase